MQVACHADRRNVIRIFSARSAIRKERKFMKKAKLNGEDVRAEFRPFLA